MKTKRTYPSGCTWCGATGIVSNNARPPMSTMSNSTTICPVCNGTKMITITEEYDDVVIEGIPINPIIDISKIEETISYLPISPSWWLSMRKRSGLTLRQVANKTGISAATISRLERGKGSPLMSDGLTRLRIFYKDEEWKEEK